MKNTFSKNELKSKAQELFKAIGADILFATVDGQFFKDQNRAELHAGVKGKVYKFENEEAKQEAKEEASTLLDENYNDVIDAVESIDDTQELRDLLASEEAGKNRKTVVAAIKDRIDELIEAAGIAQENDTPAGAPELRETANQNTDN